MRFLGAFFASQKTGLSGVPCQGTSLLRNAPRPSNPLPVGQGVRLLCKEFFYKVSQNNYKIRTSRKSSDGRPQGRKKEHQKNPQKSVSVKTFQGNVVLQGFHVAYLRSAHRCLHKPRKKPHAHKRTKAGKRCSYHRRQNRKGMS